MPFVVVVLLAEPENIHCVVPEEYIYGLDKIQADLKNWGVDKRHNNIIFWSKANLGEDTVPNAELYPPNFDLVVENEYPPLEGINSACYYGRIKRFFGKSNSIPIIFLPHFFIINIACLDSFDDAKIYCNTFRPTLPADYDPYNVNHRASPPNFFEFEAVHVDGNPFGNEDEHEEKFNVSTEQMDEADLEAFDNLVRDAENGDDDNGIEDPISVIQSANADANDSISQNSGETTSNDTTESTVTENSFDVSAAAEPEGDQSVEIGENDQVYTANHEQQQENLHFEGNSASGVKITQKIDDDIEITYVSGQKICARAEDPYVVKKNDAFSGNRPFKEVCVFHSIVHAIFFIDFNLF